MRKLLLSVAVALGVFTMSAQEQLMLTVGTLDGSVHSFAAKHLSMSVNNGIMSVANDDESKEFQLNNLDKMYFNIGYNSVADIISSDVNAEVEVFSLDGKALGLYPSISDACDSLAPDVYVFKSGKSTFKLSVK